MQRILFILMISTFLFCVSAQKKQIRTGWKIKLPEAPKAEPYKTPTPPDGWTPPTWEELEKMEWEKGWVANLRDLAKKRAKGITVDKSVAWALQQKNDPSEDGNDAKNKSMVSALCQAPASDAEVDWDAAFRLRVVAPKILNYILYSSSYEDRICGLIYAGVFSFDHRMIALADDRTTKEWRRHKGGMYDIAILRDDMTWEDGTPWTAYDVEFTYHMIMEKSIAVPAVRSLTEKLKWVKAYGPHRLVYFHKKPLVTNQWNISFPTLPKHIYERSFMEDKTMVDSKWHNYWNRYPLASGPYKLTEHETASHVLIERREDGYMHNGKQVRDKPYMKSFRFKIIDEGSVALLDLIRGNIDELRLTAKQFMRQTNDDDFYKNNTKTYGETWTYSYICWQQKGNPPNPFFHDMRVRRAMSYALDMDRWLNDNNFGLYRQGAGPWHPDSPWGTPNLELIKRDMDMAQELLEEAGWFEDSNNNGTIDKVIDGKVVEFEFTFLVPTAGTAKECAVILKENLKDLGIKVNIKQIEWASYTSMTFEHKFQASSAAWGTGTDPDTNRNLWMTEMYDGGRNYGGYANEEVDELFSKGVTEFDFEKRRKIYQRINEIIYEEQPYTFLNHRAELWAWNKVLRGMNFSPRDPFGYFMGLESIWKAKNP